MGGRSVSVSGGWNLGQNESRSGDHPLRGALIQHSCFVLRFLSGHHWKLRRRLLLALSESVREFGTLDWPHHLSLELFEYFGRIFEFDLADCPGTVADPPQCSCTLVSGPLGHLWCGGSNFDRQPRRFRIIPGRAAPCRFLRCAARYQSQVASRRRSRNCRPWLDSLFRVRAKSLGSRRSVGGDEASILGSSICSISLVSDCRRWLR